jgi:hypothetical protein
MHKSLLLGLVFCVTSVASAAAAPVEAKIERVQVVSIHVGGDDHKEDTFIYHPPTGFLIRDIQLHEVSKGGDAQYNVASKKPDEVKIHWRVASKTVRGPFKIVVNTITAFLTLDMTATLEPIPSPPQTPSQLNVKVEPQTVEARAPGFLDSLRILAHTFTITNLVAYGGTIIGALWAVWLSLPDSSKEAIIKRILDRIRRRRTRKSRGKEARSVVENPSKQT